MTPPPVTGPASPEQPVEPPEPDGPRRLLATLRPQTYGGGSPAKVLDPLVEPLWTGIRVLAAVDAAGATLANEFGDTIDTMDAVQDALAEAARADGLVVDGYLTKQAAHRIRAIYAWPDEMPSMGTLFGLRHNRAKDAVKLKEDALQASVFGPDEIVSFVATDLLWLDDTSLLDIPLLERRRVLEGVLVESDLIRVGVFVRPPVEAWVGSWRSQGFEGITYKAANSRYLPGAANPDWALSGMPRR
jgi:hypothetical protein